MDDKYICVGEQMKSILLTETTIDIRYKIRPDSGVIAPKSGVKGADMGINKILSLSDGQKTSNKNKNGRSFNDIVRDINRSKRGSKRYKRKLYERDCFINEVINKLDFNCGIIRLESNKGIKVSTGNANHYWRTEKITDKILRKSQDEQVSLLHVKPYYKSQRCFKCGYTHTDNRNKEEFKCINCFHTEDADTNASANNSISLSYSSVWKLSKEERDSGFFWN
jgi:transposase